MKGFPPKKLRRMMKAFDKLNAFCERVLAFYDQRFGAQEDDEANLIGGKRPLVKKSLA
jgi:regulator of sigma D